MSITKTCRKNARASFACIIAAVIGALCFTSCGSSGRNRARVAMPKIGTKEKGIASWYGMPYHGRRTASGEVFDMDKITAAHKKFAFGTWVMVDNLDNGKRVEVRINDRGPFVRGRVIDLSRGAARKIDMLGPGLAKVRLTVIAKPSPVRRSDAATSSSSAQIAEAPE